MSSSCFRPSPDEDGRPELSIDMCAPYGYYELEIRITGYNIGNDNNSLDIHWQINAASNEVNNVTVYILLDTDGLYVG